MKRERERESKNTSVTIWESTEQQINTTIQVNTAIQQINFTSDLDQAGQTAMYFIIEEAKKTVLDFSQGTVRVLWMCSTIIFLFWYNISMK